LRNLVYPPHLAPKDESIIQAFFLPDFFGIPDSDGIYSIAISPDNHRIVIVTNSFIQAWNIDKSAPLFFLDGQIKPRRALVTNDNRKIITSGSNPLIVVWDMDTGKKLCKIDIKKAAVQVMAITRDDRSLITGHADGSISKWDIYTGKLKFSISAHSKSCTSLTIIPHENLFASSCIDPPIKIWNLDNGKHVKSLSSIEARGANDLSILTDGKRMVSADTRIIVWKLPEGEIENIIGTKDKDPIGINSVSVTPDDRLIITASIDKIIRVWEITGGNKVDVFIGHNDYIHKVIAMNDGHRLISASFSGIRGWDLSNGKLWLDFPKQTALHAMTISKNGIRAIATSNNNEISVFNIKTGELIRRLTLQNRETRFATITFSESFIVYSTTNQRILGRNIDSDEILFQLAGHSQLVTSLAVSPDERLIASGLLDNSIWIWDIEKRSAKQILKGHFDDIRFVKFFPDGQKLLSGSSDQSIAVWDVNSGEKVDEIYMGEAIAFPGEFSLNAEKAFFSLGNIDSFECEVKSYDFKEKGWTKTFFKNIKADINILCLSPDNRFIIAGTKTGDFWIHSAIDDKEHGSFHCRGGIVSLIFIPGTSLLASADSFGEVIVWNFPKIVGTDGYK